jgi:hypothetical protein
VWMQWRRSLVAAGEGDGGGGGGVIIIILWEICQNNAHAGIVFCFNARNNAYFIVTPQRTNCILF